MRRDTKREHTHTHTHSDVQARTHSSTHTSVCDHTTAQHTHHTYVSTPKCRISLRSLQERTHTFHKRIYIFMLHDLMGVISCVPFLSGILFDNCDMTSNTAAHLCAHIASGWIDWVVLVYYCIDTRSEWYDLCRRKCVLSNRL